MKFNQAKKWRFWSGPLKLIPWLRKFCRMSNEPQQPQKNQPNEESALQHLGIIARPLNLVKTVAAATPIGSSVNQMLSQIEGERVDKRLTALESPDSDLAIKVHKLEQSQ